MPRAAKRKNPFGGEVYEHIKDKGSAVGNYIEMKGKDWGESCEPADAEKTFKLTVTDFSAMRTEWDDGIPSAGFQLTEAGTSGEASNSDPFWMKYPMPFLKHWWPAMDAQKETADAAASEESDAPEPVTEEPAKKKPRIYKYLKFQEESEVLGHQHGDVKRVYKCKISDAVTGMHAKHVVHL